MRGARLTHCQPSCSWSDLGFEPEEALAFYSGQLLDEKPDDSATGLYQLEAAPGSLVSTLKRSAWVRATGRRSQLRSSASCLAASCSWTRGTAVAGRLGARS